MTYRLDAGIESSKFFFFFEIRHLQLEIENSQLVERKLSVLGRSEQSQRFIYGHMLPSE